MNSSHKFTINGTHAEGLALILADRSASWGAKGLLDYLLSPGNGREKEFGQLMEVGGATAQEVEGLLKELESLGYARPATRRRPDGTWECFTEIGSNPLFSSSNNASTTKLFLENNEDPFED